ncbi:MAG: glycine cleavage T C-terminal barrel domain-containing protein, partial [Ilumatobacteraceae bacterium]
PIRIGNEVVGRVKSGGQGFTIGKAIGYAYFPIQHARPGIEIEVEFFGQWVSGVVAQDPLFDPAGLRIRA